MTESHDPFAVQRRQGLSAKVLLDSDGFVEILNELQDGYTQAITRSEPGQSGAREGAYYAIRGLQAIHNELLSRVGILDALELMEADTD